eukprot:scaffold65263_cov50-Phaeocystis_antarctica.AAC.8
MWSAQAQAEGLTLRVAENTTGYLCVYRMTGKRSKSYKAEVRRGGKDVHLGCFATAEEAALCFARSPEGHAAAAERAAATPPLTSEEARQQAQAEGLTLLVAGNKAGYFGVHITYPGRPRPYQAQVKRGGKSVSLGHFATAEEAALCIARSPEGQVAAQKAAAAPPPSPPLTSEEARQRAQGEGLTLRVADNNSGYFGVCLVKPGQPKPYLASVSRGGKMVHLGSFVNAEEAALYVARSPEGQAVAKRAAAAAPPARPLTSEDARQQAQAEELTLLKANNNKTGYFGVYHQRCLSKPFQVRVKRGGKQVHLGCFVTAEEAALCVARSTEGQAAAKAAAAPPPAPTLTSEEVRQQAQAEELTLLVANNTTGFFGVYHHPGRSKPYESQVRRGGKMVHLGRFATAEEAALCFARSPEGRAAAQRAAAAPPPLTGDDNGDDDTGEEGEEETFEVLDAVEVLVASDDDDDEALAMEEEEVTHVVERKRAREGTR